MNISDNKLVILQYALNVKNDDGQLELMEETTPEQPLQYFHGMGMMLPKFEENLEGLTEGDKFEFMIPVAEAYGEYDESNIIDLPKNIFLLDGKFDDEKIFAGAIVPLADSEGNRLNAEVVEVKDDSVTVDLNHPLAGEDLYFTGRIISVTQPTDEELHAMMHHSCGGGCNCGSCGDEGCSGCSGSCNA